MAKLDQRRINFVKNLPMEVRARVLYEFLKKGTSNRNIERKLESLAEEDGWQAWAVIHFYGFNGSNKARYPNLNLEGMIRELQKLNEDELEELHLFEEAAPQKVSHNVVISKNDGRDIFHPIKVRQGQNKLRKILLFNYESKCALCDITDPKLLITSHIKAWAKSSPEERIDPRNGILLCRLHDGLFDSGFISLSDSYEVLYAKNFGFKRQGISTDLSFRVPSSSPPDSKFLKEHRRKYGFE